MKALIRKYPDTPTKPSQDEIYLAPWLDWIDSTTGAPLTDENYGYALCADFEPTFNEDHPELTPDDFAIREHTEDVPLEDGEGTVTRRFWTATYVGPRCRNFLTALYKQTPKHGRMPVLWVHSLSSSSSLFFRISALSLFVGLPRWRSE